MLSLSAFFHASSLCLVSSAPCRPSFSLSSKPSSTSLMAVSARIAVVGDVHDDWNLEEDTKALELLQPDLVLFTGDFGNENVDLVQSVADLKFPKAVILGNHDSWYTQKFSQKMKDGVQLQLECTLHIMHELSSEEIQLLNENTFLETTSLGEEHVGYRHLDFPTLKLSVVGGRPFSCGGDQLFRKRLLSERYGVQDMEGSAMRIYNTASRTPENHLVIFLAHNGPTGLGSNLNDICGKDWVFGGGDHGDPDLAQAIAHLKETTKLNIPLVVFGHMHKELAYGNGLRKMIVVSTDNTIYLNGAIVPRVKRINDDQRAPNRSFMNSETSQLTPESKGTRRAFTLVEILEGRVDKIAETWVSVTGDVTSVEEEHVLFKCSN